MRHLLLALAAFCALFFHVNGHKHADEIKSLPGLTFSYNSRQFSGWLETPSQNLIHYWLVESQSEPYRAPLVLWLNGGPGASSLIGLFSENGPFYPNPDGKTLFENVFSWNKIANVLYIESPQSVGYSYRDPKAPANYSFSDDLTAQDNVDALAVFLNRFPEYKARDFYITGESYGGVYIPTLAKLVIQKIMAQPTQLPINLVGLAIGNGILSFKHQTNSFVDLAFYRGIIGKTDYEFLKTSCCAKLDNEHPLQYCDFSSYLQFLSNGSSPAIHTGDQTHDKCADAIYRISQNDLWRLRGYNAYDSNQDCYTDDFSIPSSSPSSMSNGQSDFLSALRLQRALAASSTTPIITDGIDRFIDQGSRVNVKSTDPFGGFPCYSDAALTNYLNLPELRDAIHVPKDMNIEWQDSSDFTGGTYLQQYPDMSDFFQWYIDQNYPLNILVYNGDADGVCNFLGDEWFVEGLGLDVVSERHAWYYRQGNSYVPTVAGYIKKFTKGSVNIDLLTVKGAGHYVPTFSPGPSLQMISNFITTQRNYNSSISISLTPRPPAKNFPVEKEELLTRKQADKVYNLPGLTFDPNFDQFSGYLRASPGNYLHYWLVTSQANPDTDPLVLWLNGGPGCSSIGGLLTELGPIRPNPDGTTLHENVYAWNKGANVLFLEGPRNVGFSYQDRTVNNDTTYNDDKTAYDNYLAIKDFFTVYPEFKGRKFYVAGESYGGVYVPTLTSLLIQKIQSGDLPGVNLVGMSVGNGELSAIQQINSNIPLLYYRGFIGKQEWDNLMRCFDGTNYQDLPLVDWSKYYTIDFAGNMHPKGNSYCDIAVFNLGQSQWALSSINDVYNIYQDCYQQKAVIFGSRNLRPLKESIRQSSKTYRVSPNDDYNTLSTDALGGFPCYASDKATSWLNSPEVRAALHIPSYVQNWTDCNDNINAQYIQQHNDTGSVFDQILTSGYPLRMLVYNGDVDLACNFLGDQWFVEGVAATHALSVSRKHGEWKHRNQIAGYQKQFSSADGKVTIDLVTVKGGGHLVPMDRPAPALQMFTSFISGRDLSTPVVYTTDEKELKKQYQVEEKLAAAVGPESAFDFETPTTRRLKAALRRRKRSVAEATEPLKEEPKAPETRYVPPPPPGEDYPMRDKITALPGLNFDASDMYSGYLTTVPGVHLHYWLVTSERSKHTTEKDPLILWLNGGPGCSSLGGLFTELGPFRPTKDGSTLVENVYTWAKVGHVLFLESPRGVGFSYSNDTEATVPSSAPYNDTLTAEMNLAALKVFMERWSPVYDGRDFYISGESYGGVYIPTLTDLVVSAVEDGSLNVNFKGVIIGNGELSDIQQINSAVDLLYFRGMFDLDDWKRLSKCCPMQTDIGGYIEPCNFTQYVTYDDHMNVQAIPSENATANECGKLVEKFGYDYVWNSLNDVYNTYQDCYNPPYANTGLNAYAQAARMSAQQSHTGRSFQYPGTVLSNNYTFIDQAKLTNRDSTDAFRGFYCYQGPVTASYLNRADVQAAIHVGLGLPAWQDCNDVINNNYIRQYHDTTPVFESIFTKLQTNNKLKHLKFLIYNGDADMACQFKGDEWFVEKLATRQNMVKGTRAGWNFTIPGFNPRLGGFNKLFTLGPSDLLPTATIQFTTIKGAGHLVPLDRPAQILQVLNNFVYDQDVSTPLPAKLTQPHPLTTNPTPPKPPSQKELDEIHALPELTYTPNFKQYSGYLKGSVAGNYLHYWLVESQRNPFSDPIVLWLNGGPGCSSLGGLLSENGPFRVNPDGQTIFENVFAWNKVANVLYLESPRGVGFSYQDQAANNDTTWNDDKTAADAAAALLNFFKAYPEYQGRTFYVAGESYGGVYVPTLTRLLVQQLGQGATGPFAGVSVNFQGMVVGNGYLSDKWDSSTFIDYLYFHGVVGKTNWDRYRACCDPPGEIHCNVTKYMDAPPDSSDCAKVIHDVYDDPDFNNLDPYNVYQQCYEQDHQVFGSAASRHKPWKVMEYHQLRNIAHTIKKRSANADTKPVYRPSLNQLPQYSFASNDANGGYLCYMNDAIAAYLNQKQVRNVLHIPDYVQSWTFCSDINYEEQYNVGTKDMTNVFVDILQSTYVQGLREPFRMLIYNGDADMACGFIEAEFFIENLVSQRGATVKQARTPWKYALPGVTNANDFQVAGFQKSFDFGGKLSIDLLTVKGSGHFVPTDRPGPALQMVTNFFAAAGNFSQPLSLSLSRAPLKRQFQPLPLAPPAPLGPATTTTTTPSTSTATKTTTKATTTTTAPATTTTTVSTASTTTTPGSTGSTDSTTSTAGPTSTSTQSGGGTTTTLPTAAPTTKGSAIVNASSCTSLLGLFLALLVQRFRW